MSFLMVDFVTNEYWEHEKQEKDRAARCKGVE